VAPDPRYVRLLLCTGLRGRWRRVLCQFPQPGGPGAATDFLELGCASAVAVAATSSSGREAS